MENDHLAKENQHLRQYIQQLEEDQKTIVKAIVKALKSIDMYPFDAGKNHTGKLTSMITKIITQMTVNPNGLKERFSFIDDLMPLIDKYTKIYKDEL